MRISRIGPTPGPIAWRCRGDEAVVTARRCLAVRRCCCSWAALRRAPGATTRPISALRLLRKRAGRLCPTFASPRYVPAMVRRPSRCRRRQQRSRRRIFSRAPAAISKSAMSISAIRSRRETCWPTSSPLNSTIRLRKPRRRWLRTGRRCSKQRQAATSPRSPMRVTAIWSSRDGSRFSKAITTV